MELKEVAKDAIGATTNAVMTCYRCTKQESFSGVDDSEIIKKAIDKGWRKAVEGGDGRLVCKKCSK